MEIQLQPSVNDQLTQIEQLLYFNKNFISGPPYSALCKRAAELYFENGMVSQGIYHLSESHGASLRQECSYQYGMCQLKDLKPGLSDEHISHWNEDSSYATLLQHVKEMPKEWTLVQITQPYCSDERWSARTQKSKEQPSRLHIVRYHCGKENFVEPCHVEVPEPDGEASTGTTVFQLLKEATDIHSSNVRDLKKNRLDRCTKLKAAVHELISGWLKEWSCLLLGKACNQEQYIYASARSSIDAILQEYSTANIENLKGEEKQRNARALLYCVASGCAYLSEEYIERAVTSIVGCDDAEPLKSKLTECIWRIRNDAVYMIVEKRHPVILILDERLECLPWEMTSPLRKHPVSRVPSIHFAYALFKQHEHSIISGNRVIENTLESGFYLINPDGSLSTTEKRMVDFVRDRFPQWDGIVGKEPTQTEFANALTEKRVLLYCGHGNGTQYLRTSDIEYLQVQAVPLLFGCSSVRSIDLGGRANFSGLSYKYLMANCPCVIGMLWNVTSNDTDLISLCLLNNWLPGEPIKNLKDYMHVDTSIDLFENAVSHEPELLRAIKGAQGSALMYSNSAALVACGIPVIVKSSKD